MKPLRFFTALLLISFFFARELQAYWVWSPESGKFVNLEKAGYGAAEEEYDRAMEFFRERDLDEARKRLEDLLKKYPSARIAAEAQYRLGTVYEEQGDYMKAYRAYRKLIDSYPATERFGEVIEREFKIGNLFLAGKKGKFAGLEILPSLPRAAEIFEHVVKFAPFSDFGDKAQFHLGLAYKKWGRFEQALEAFQAVIDQYPKSDLVAQARFQLAETSFVKSSAQFRDQRALDQASAEVDRFLGSFPDTGASEKAAKLRQVIDEKNAEKNYRIALYYEKENFIQSALIYYSDVVSRYKHTVWAEKSAQKMETLKAPADYILKQQDEVGAQIALLQKQIQEAASDEIEKGRLERQLERLQEKSKSLEKSKEESLERRQRDLKRRENELKEKFKNLEKKRKWMQKNPSEDFKKAIDRWQASLEAEQEALEAERRQIQGWREELGVQEKDRWNLDFLPILGEGPGPLEKVRQIEAKKFYKLSEKKKSLLEEKELLYKQHGEVSGLLKSYGGASSEAWFKALEAENKEQYDKLLATRAEIERLQAELEAKDKLYRQHYGKTSWSGLPGTFVKSLHKSVDILNPFGPGSPASSSDPQTLLEHRMHLKEKIAAEQGVVQVLSDAFNAEIALQEQKRLLAALSRDQQADPLELRKSIKTLEKKIRKGYEEIQDRHERKKEYVEDLSRLLENKALEENHLEKSGRVLTAPARGTARFWKAFIFGLPNREVELTEEAEKLPDAPNYAAMKALRESIELESLLIESRSREIVQLQKKLEILKAQASLAGGYKFRPVLIDVPYQFLGEAIANARKLLPGKNRQDLLVTRLNEETAKLESFKKELRRLEKRIPRDLPEEQPAAAVLEDQPAASNQGAPDPQALQSEIEGLNEKLEIQRDIYSREKEIAIAAIDSRKAEAVKAEETKSEKKREREEKLAKELKEIEEDLAGLIKEESELENEEFSILEKRILELDHQIKKAGSKVLSQDLLTERERIEERLSQLESRKDFLANEGRRFNMDGDLALPGSPRS